MDNLISYAKSLNSSQEIIYWLNTTAKKALKEQKTNESQLEHVVDWLNSNAAPQRLRKLSISDAIRLSDKWMQSNQKKGKDLVDTKEDIEQFMKFKDGSVIVKLVSKKAFEREGFLMSHCLGGYNLREGYDIYSLRDAENKPHATFEVNISDKDILQIKGKGNGPIHPKYIDRVLAFFKKIGMNIRSSEMKNLGYYEVPEVHLSFVRKKICKNEKLVKIKDVYYVV